jgi:glyceraldehyde 3-phosphate dehydrogenase
VLYVWYDNEYGYSCQVVRVVEAMAGTHPIVLPERQPVLVERVPDAGLAEDVSA